MKLRPRTKVPIYNGSAAAPPAPTAPPAITRQQSRPISISDTSSSVEDDSDMEDKMESVSPTKDRRGPRTTAHAARLTENNLEILQEEITSSEEVPSEDQSPLPPPTPSTRLVQAKNFLLAENQDTCPELPTRIQQIADYLQAIPRETREKHSSVYREVRHLLRSHRARIGEREKAHRAPPTMAPLPSSSSESPTPLPSTVQDSEHERRADPFEWTNKLDDLIDSVRFDDDKLNREYVLTQMRELARPLNGGRLPDQEHARRLVNERVLWEHARMVEGEGRGMGKGREKREDGEGRRGGAFWHGERLPWEREEEEEGGGDEGSKEIIRQTSTRATRFSSLQIVTTYPRRSTWRRARSHG